MMKLNFLRILISKNFYSQIYLMNVKIFLLGRVPKRKENEPGFKCVQVVRKQDERKKLGTMSCKECETVCYIIPSFFSILYAF